MPNREKNKQKTLHKVSSPQTQSERPDTKNQKKSSNLRKFGNSARKFVSKRISPKRNDKQASQIRKSRTSSETSYQSEISGNSFKDTKFVQNYHNDIDYDKIEEKVQEGINKQLSKKWAEMEASIEEKIKQGISQGLSLITNEMSRRKNHQNGWL